jgi:hypothetical protein
MLCYKLLHDFPNVLVEIANKMGLQDIFCFCNGMLPKNGSAIRIAVGKPDVLLQRGLWGN